MLTAVHRLLTDPAFRQKAAKLRQQLGNWPGAVNVAAFLRQTFAEKVAVRPEKAASVQRSSAQNS